MKLTCEKLAINEVILGQNPPKSLYEDWSDVFLALEARHLRFKKFQIWSSLIDDALAELFCSSRVFWGLQ